MTERLGESLVRQGLLSSEANRRAVDAQKLMGGRLGTNLLELGLITEGPLLDALGRQRSSCTVGRAELTSIPEPVLRSIPEKLARRYQMVPFRVRGKTLFIASLDPGDLLREDEIAFLTSFMVRTCVALELHLRLALRQYYQVPIDRRFVALARRVAAGGEAEAAPPPRSSEPSAPPDPPMRTASEAPAASPRQPSPRMAPAFMVAETPPPSTPSPAARAEASAPHLPVGPAPDVEFIELDAADLASLRRPTDPQPVDGSAPEAPAHPLSAAQPAAAVAETSFADLTPGDAAATTEVLPPGNQLPHAEERAAQPETVEEPTSPEPLAPESFDAAEPERNLESRLATATRQLQQADIRDEIGDVLLDFGEGLFRRRVLLIHRRDRIVGWRGAGEGVDEVAVRALDLDAQAPSVFAGLRDASSFWLGPLPALPANQMLLSHLGGPSPRDCLVLPVTLRSKIVCLLYVDNVENAIAGGPVAEMKRLVAKAGLAFEVYILKNKIRML